MPVNAGPSTAKRKANGHAENGDADHAPTDGKTKTRRSTRHAANGDHTPDESGKPSSAMPPPPPPPPPGPPPLDAAAIAQSQQQAIAAGFLSMFDPVSLKMPVLPTKEEMGKILLEVRKKALMEEYGVQ